MWLFVICRKKELLCSRNDSRCFFFFHINFFHISFFHDFFCFSCFLDRLYNFFFCGSSVNCVSRSSNRSSISSENYGREGQSNESGNDCGQNFFHL